MPCRSAHVTQFTYTRVALFLPFCGRNEAALWEGQKPRAHAAAAGGSTPQQSLLSYAELFSVPINTCYSTIRLSAFLLEEK